MSVPINDTYTISGSVVSTLSMQLPDHILQTLVLLVVQMPHHLVILVLARWMVMSRQEEWFLLVVVDLMITHLVVVLQSIRLLY